MERTYEGAELESFAHAKRWKSYVRAALRPFIAGDVVELGAGIGETTRALLSGFTVRSWTCVEPDPEMVAKLGERAAAGELGEAVSVVAGTIEDLPRSATSDTALYVDVLEHIEDDRGELAAAAARLRPGGRIVVLSPAWPFLYSEFDRAIGHYRRYTRPTLEALTPAGTTIEAAFYLDTIGMLASAANRLLLSQKLPTLRQVLVWDRTMVPLSRLIDPLLGRRLGRSVVTVWRRA